MEGHFREGAGTGGSTGGTSGRGQALEEAGWALPRGGRDWRRYSGTSGVLVMFMFLVWTLVSGPGKPTELST